jgi:Tfp pilus assembly protein PilE
MQERFYLSNETCTNDMTQLDFTTDPFVTDSGSYTIDIVPGADHTNYAATATYNGADAETQECQWFRIDGRGDKTSGPSLDCWMR